MRSSLSRLVVLVSIVPLLLVGCVATTATPSSRSSPRPGELGVGFYDRASPPAPEGTINPEPGSWTGVRPSAGYTVVLVGFGSDAPTRTLIRAVREWAKQSDVNFTSSLARSPAHLVSTIEDAIDRKPDLIISVGNAMVDPLAAVTPSALHQQFLILGAEIAEPTSNVTAADWTGAGYRGEGLGTPSEYDPKTFTDERAARALRAGVAAVVKSLTGIVVWVR